MRTSRFLHLPSGAQVAVVIEARFAPMAPRGPSPGAPASVLRVVALLFDQQHVLTAMPEYSTLTAKDVLRPVA